MPDPIHIWYNDNKGGSYQGLLTLGKEYTINTYEGHVFFFTKSDDKSFEYARHVMNRETVVYGIWDPSSPAPAELLDKHEKESKFMEEYYNRTGIRYVHYRRMYRHTPYISLPSHTLYISTVPHLIYFYRPTPSMILL